jgi:anaerobic magnesium-protoporphyrin IX monomethyl ester cyclase
MKSKVLLINPLYRTGTYDPELQECLGIELLAAVLRQNGCQVKLIDAALQNVSHQHIIQDARRFQPDLVGFSVMSDGSLEDTASLASGIKLVLSSGPEMIAGGQLLSTYPESLQYCLPVRRALRFEGEKGILKIVHSLEKGKMFRNVPGLVILKNSGTFLTTDPEYPIRDLDSLPFAARDFAELLLHYRLPANIQGSRGCMGKCSFCATPATHIPGAPRWRARSPSHIADEIEHLHRKYGFSSFNFVDDDFLGPDQEFIRADAFAREISKRDLSITFGIQCRLSTAKEEDFKRLYQAGLRYIFLGVESADPGVLKKFKKTFSPSYVHRIIATLRALDIDVEIGFIPFHPWTGLEILKVEFEFLRKTKSLNFRTVTNRLMVIPSTSCYQELYNAGFTNAYPDGSLRWSFFDEAVKDFYEALVWILMPVQPLWTLIATTLPPLLLEAEVKKYPETQESLNLLRSSREILDNWIENTAFFCLDTFLKGQKKEEFKKLRHRGKKLALQQLKMVNGVSYGRLRKVAYDEIEEILHENVH